MLIQKHTILQCGIIFASMIWIKKINIIQNVTIFNLICSECTCLQIFLITSVSTYTKMLVKHNTLTRNLL